MSDEPGTGVVVQHWDEDLPVSLRNRVSLAIQTALDWGQIDGEDHKMWVIDQMLRELLEGDYHRYIDAWEAEPDGIEFTEWDTGIAP